MWSILRMHCTQQCSLSYYVVAQMHDSHNSHLLPYNQVSDDLVSCKKSQVIFVNDADTTYKSKAHKTCTSTGHAQIK